MNYLYLIITVVFMALENFLLKLYNNKNRDLKTKNNTYLFYMVMSLSAMFIFIIISKGKLTYHALTYLYAAGFAIGGLCALVFSMRSFKHGSMSLSALIIAYSLLVPSIYGVLFLNEQLKLTTIVGIAMLIVSLYLINKPTDMNKITRKWIVFVLLAFAGNGFCATVQKVHQTKFNGLYKTEFMLVSLAVIFTFCFLMVLRQKKGEVFDAFKSGWKYAVGFGLCNGLANLLIMIIAGTMPAIIMYPSLSGGSIILTFIISVCFLKEKLSKNQKIGFFLGALSIIIFNL